MQRKNFFETYITVILCLVAIESSAQLKIAGNWELIKKQHMNGPSYANSLPENLIIETKGDSLIWTSFKRNETKALGIRSAIPLNGEPVTVVKSRKIVKTMSWSADEKKLFIKSIYYREDNEAAIDFTREENFQLSGDGKELKFDKKSIETRSEDWHVKGVYKRN